MGTQKVVNNPLGSYQVSVDRDSLANGRQAVGLDFGAVDGEGVWTPRRVSESDPLPVAATFAGTSSVNVSQVGGTAVSVNSGDSNNGTARVVIPNNQNFLATQGGNEPTRFVAGAVYDYSDSSWWKIRGDTNGYLHTKIDNTSVEAIPISAPSSSSSGTITAAGQIVSIANLYAYTSIQIWGAYTLVDLIFEYSPDGTTWVAVPIPRIDTGVYESSTGIISNTARAWMFTCPAAQFRVRCTSFGSGTVNVSINKFGNFLNAAPSSRTSIVAKDSSLTFNPSTSFNKSITFVSFAQTVVGTTTLAAASASNFHKVVSAVYSVSTTGTLKFADGTIDLTGAMDTRVGAPTVLPASILPYFQTGAVNRPLNITTTGGLAKGVIGILTEP